MTNYILKFFGWYCDPLAAMPVPTKKQSQPAGVQIPKDISFDGNGKAFKNVHTDDGIVAEEVTIGRTSSRTHGDEVVLATPPPSGKPKLNPNKYFRLKTFWAKGLSAKATADALKNERGFKERTLDYYWKAFRMSQRIDAEKGAKTPLPSAN